MTFSKERRKFILSLGSSVAAGIIFPDYIFGNAEAANLEKKTNEIGGWFQNAVKKPFEQLKTENDKQDFRVTFVQSFILFTVEKMFVKIIKKYNLHDGLMSEEEVAALFKEMWANGDYYNLFVDDVKKVFFETVWFQYIPSLFTDIIIGNEVNWSVGVPVSFIFAASHNLTKNELGKYKFEKDFIPWPQFFQGILYWYLIRKAGPLSTFSAHWLHNFLITMDSLVKKK
jgi:hypothetical protein